LTASRSVIGSAAAERRGSLDNTGPSGPHCHHLVPVQNKRFEGPSIGDMMKKRQAEILAAESAVGEIRRWPTFA
jgi:hypothetical protein